MTSPHTFCFKNYLATYIKWLGLFLIDEHISFSLLENFLRNKNWFQENEQITSISKAGEGNMNVVLRVETNVRSIIAKQSRPFVQKYQQIPAPLHRIEVEQKFYKAIQKPSLQQHIPKIIGYDANSYMLVLEDLGQCDDMSTIYQARSISGNVLKKLVVIIQEIHQTTIPKGFPKNLEMRRLNHQHIFELPFLSENGFSLDNIQEGLQALSEPYKKDLSLKKEIDKIGARYLEQGDTLLHGDYYPGSWMTTEENLYVIDPEFGFVGFPEFDLGVMAAHLIMATGKQHYLNEVITAYTNAIDAKLTAQITGIEIMRRIIGLAQLPLERTLDEKEYLLQLGHQLILS